MKNQKRITLKQLIQNTEISIDDALITLWDNNINDINDENFILFGRKLNQVKNVLKLPSKKDLVSPNYWKKRLNLSDSDFNFLIEMLGININSKAKNLPKGSVKKLNNDDLVYSILNKLTESNKEITKDIETEKRSEKITESCNKIATQWSIVGHEKEIRYLSFEEIIKIHNALVKDFALQSDPIDPPGLRSENLLESAIFRPHTSNSETLKYPTIEMAAAALLHSLIHNHPFHNGNKRTALVAMLVFLDENGYMFTCDDIKLFQFVLLVAKHRNWETKIITNIDNEVMEISKWICQNTRPILHGERPIPFRTLKQILSEFNCSLENTTRGRNIKIAREVSESEGGIFRKRKTRVLQTFIKDRGDGQDVKRNELNRLRTALKLDEENGIDSKSFYSHIQSNIDDFIVYYQKILKRLARL